MAVSIDKERAIHKAAIQVISEYGFHKAKMAKIAEVAGVSAGSLYTYYSDKDHILDRIFEMLWKKDWAGLVPLSERKDLSPQEKLEGAIDLVFDVLTGDRNLIIVFVNEFNNFMKNKEVSFSLYYHEFLGAFSAIIEEGQATGVFNPHIPANVTCDFILGGIRKSLYGQVMGTLAVDGAALRTHIKAMIRRGVLV
ncbi:TetR/AcrR family transcriptional regulator [Desulfoluna sp.]|uniref:TetR/AcrR family transcriptional regulator n=1 Tax=Desulfoluna sp. TaxID=2045199 RepID=UPI002634E392|nr:TetR/AcrR family transcriptional regulator [Desulfoluna sp.]